VDFLKILYYVRDLAIPLIILIFVVAIFIKLFVQERDRHKETKDKYDALSQRIEERLWHELDELEKLLREERAKIR